MALTYGEYLKIDGLLDLQRTRSEDHDEMLFIIIHQVYELWFKESLHELDYLAELLNKNDLSRAHRTMKRLLTVLKIMVAQIDILETMTPLEFLSFRTRLENSSGFQSYQFRELEFALGRKSADVFKRVEAGTPEQKRLRERYETPALWDWFVRFLHARGFDVPTDVLDRDVTMPVEPSPALQRVLVDIYRGHDAIANFCERLVDFDEGLQEWRYRHVKMVERTIGAKPGTGGSPGVAYLLQTINKPLFPDLWAIRSEF